MATYTYAPLKNPESSIRLLSITSIDDGNVSVSLRETPNLNAEPYHCLSYTWGPSEPQLQITCDGRIFQSRQNLYDALVHLQRVQPEKMTAIWIDAICIDQQNDTEKGFQLKRMHAIYAGAQSVIIWLGTLPATPNSATLISRFEDVAQRVKQSFPTLDDVAFGERMLTLNDSNIADRESVPLIKGITSEDWLAVRKLVYNGYFRRAWIWQEVVASTSDPIVVCGGHVLSSWEALRKASHALVIFGDAVLIREGVSESRPDYAEDGMSTVNIFGPM